MGLAEEGRVVRMGDDNTVWVEAQRSSACEGCTSKSSCHAGSQTMMEAHAQNDAKAQVGDRVMMEIPHQSIIKISMLIYIFPVVALLAGAFTGQYLATTLGIDTQVAQALVGFGFFFISVAVVVVIGRKAGKNKQYMPKVTKILN